MKKSIRQLVLAASFCFLLTQPSTGTGNDNPTGVTGDYNGTITTGGSYDPYTGNAKRFVTDLAVTGSLGAYPLKWTRTLNTRGVSGSAFGQGGTWRHNYQWGLWLRPFRGYNYYPNLYEGPDGILSYPDGRTKVFKVEPDGTFWEDTSAEPADRLVPAPGGGGNYDLLLADGGRVEFRHNAPQTPTLTYSLTARKIIDPHGLETILERDTSNRLWKIHEPGGRYLEITYHTFEYTFYPGHGPPVTRYVQVISRVQAFAGPQWPTEKVDYGYTPEDVGGVSLPSVKYYNLTQVDYDDDTQAIYGYFPSNSYDYVSARIRSCDDLRFGGAMARIEYEYATHLDTGGPVAAGQIKAEKNLTTHQVVSRVTYPPWHVPYTPADFVRTETRGDGRTRTFQYSWDEKAELLSYTDFKGQPSTITWPDGTAGGYKKILTDPRGNTTSVEKEHVAGAILEVTRGNGTPVKYAYTDPNNPYYLEKKTDQLGNITSYTRYPPTHQNRHRVERIDYPDGGWESFLYNNFGQVLEHRLTSGGTAKFTYDLRGLKQTYTPPLTPSDESPGLNPTRYFYYQSGLHTDRLHYVVDPRGNGTWYEYNGRGQVTKVTHQDGKFTESHYNPNGTLEWTEDELRHRTSYQYDEYKRATKVTNHLTQSVTTGYAPWTGHGPLSHTSSSVYRTTSHLGKTTDYDYDENFRRIRATEAPGTPDEATTTSTYDPAGNLETVTKPNGQPGQLHAGAHSTYEYDDRNRRKSLTDTLDRKTEWEYDDANNMTKEKRPDQKIRTWDFYDGMNRIKQTTGFLNEPTSYDYDLAGNMTLMTDSKGAQYVYAYDELNRKKSATYPPDANNQVRTETWLYDIVGNLKVSKNPAGQFKHFEYDNRNRQRRSYWNDSETSETPNRTIGTETTTVVDDASRVTEIKTNGGETAVTYGYDAANRKLWEDQTVSGFTRRVQTDPDDDGNRANLSVGGVYALTYDYTQRQQLSHINTGGSQYFEFTYDKNGNLKKRHNKLQGMDSTSFEYDVLDRVKMCEQTQRDGLSFARSHFDEYDLRNNVKSISREEDGNKGERFEYDDANQLSSASYNMQIDPPPPGQTPTPPPGQTPTPPPGQTPTPPPAQTPTPPPGQTPTPPPQQQAAEPAFYVDGGTFFTTQPRIVTLTTATAGASMRYTFGETPPTASTGTPIASGGTVSVTPTEEGRTLNAIAFKAGMSDSAVHSATYYYEGGNAAAGGPYTVTYNNDPLNRVSVTANGTATYYTPSGINQYKTVTGQTLLYDSNFNLSGYDALSYVYDADKRLTAASWSGTGMAPGQSAQFLYDGLGRCVKRTIGNVTTVITYDGWKPIAEWNGAGGLVAWNLYGSGADEVLVRHQAGTSIYLYYHLDAMGHVVFLLDENGGVLEKYSYDAFGRPKIMDGNGSERATTAYGNRFLFTGREYLATLGIYDYRNRVYHPTLGRFLQVDPIGFKGDAMNLYRYCRGNPINRSDPTGLTDVNYVGDELRSYLDDLNPEDVISVSAHGTPLGLKNNFWGGKDRIDLPVKQVAQDVQRLDKFKNNKDMAIRLYSCRAGDWKTAALQGQESPAQKLARETQRHVQATGADINPRTWKTWKTDFCKDLSWYDFSPDGSEPKKIPDPTGIRRGGLYTNNSLGGDESRSDTRRSFDAYGSTTEMAALWEETWGLGGWLSTQRNLGQ